MNLLCDIGGTHIRIACADNGRIDGPEKFAVSGFTGLDGALRHYLTGRGLPPDPCAVAISTAAVDDGAGVYRFTNNPNPDWIVDPNGLRAGGWQVERVINDFSASAWGTIGLAGVNVDTIRDGNPADGQPWALLGPGTGLGLAFVTPLPNGQHHIQPTFGGHMMSLVLTDEQFLIVELVRQTLGTGYTIVPENLCSGRTLPTLYRAVCEASGEPAPHTTPENILNHPDDPCVCDTLRLFHEFLGLFAHQSIVTGNAFGGLYLDGGVLHRLRERDLFDAATFLRFMTLNPVPVVKAALENCPVHIITDPYIALRGLLRIEG